MTNLFTQSTWWNYSDYTKGYWTLQYEAQRSGTTMQYRFYWKVWLSASGAYYNDAMKIKLHIDGVAYDVTVKAYGSNTGWSYEGTTGWYNVSNKLSGSTSFYADIIDTSSNTTRSTSSTYYLTVIGAASILGTISDFNIGATIPITISKYNSSYSDSLTVKIGSVSIKTITNVTNGYQLTFTSSELNTIYNNMPSNSATFTFILSTASGTTSLGSSTKTPKGTLTNVEPTLSATVVDTNSTTIALTGSNLKLVKFYSNAKITITCSGKYNADISSKIVNGASVSGTEYTINGIQNSVITVSVTDSRGNSKTTILNPVMVNYIPLTLNASAYRISPTTGEVYLQYSGNVFQGSFGSVTSNPLTLSWKYRIKGSSTWITGGSLTPTISNNTYQGNPSLGTTFDYQNIYEFIVYYSDRLCSSNTGAMIVAKGEPIISWDANDVYINGRLTVNGGLDNKGSAIPSGADLNTEDFLIPGTYYSTTFNLLHSPAATSYIMMKVEVPADSSYIGVYRTIVTSSSMTYVQIVSYSVSTNSYTYGNWIGAVNTTMAAYTKASAMSDYIISQAVSGNNYYRKWNSGKAEIWSNDAFTITSATAMGNLYYSQTLTKYLPFQLKNTYMYGSCNTSGAYVSNTTYNTALSSSLTFRAWFPQSISSVTVRLYILGDWK